MATATYTKSGMIHLPVEIKRKLNLKPGDKISFVETEDGFQIIPIRDLFDLITPEERELANKIAKELKDDHIRERSQSK